MSLLNVNLNKLLETKVNLDGYLILYCLHSKNKELIINYIQKCRKIQKESIDFLIDEGYITVATPSEKYLIDDLTLTDKAVDTFFEVTESWIDTWYELWPKGIQSGGFYVKTDKTGCLKKLKKFMEDNPHYTKGVILGATKKYIGECRDRNYQMMKLAPYFIVKDGISMLDGYCQSMINRPSVEQNNEERL